jgi:serine/threonine protein phosphatase PrpC
MPTVSSDVGVVRDHNEDAAHIDGRRSFFIVADGMGGHAAGEVASAMAVETVRKSLETARATIDAFAKHPSDPGRRDLVQLLQNSVLSAHQAVYQRGSRESDKQGMGTTLDVVLVAGPEAFVAHVGDSRTYLIRDGRCAQITTDHTVAEVLVIEGKLSIEEAQVSPLRTILVNAIGVSADVGVEMAHLQLRPGDRLLLCSDGLHDYFVAEQEIADKLSGTDPGGALGEMVEMAKERGGHDNITGVLVNVLEVTTREGVPAEIEHDETMPVDLSKPHSTEWSDDEETQNLSPKDIAAKVDQAERKPTRDLETDVTLEAPAVRVTRPPDKADKAEATPRTKTDEGEKPEAKADGDQAEATPQTKTDEGERPEAKAADTGDKPEARPAEAGPSDGDKPEAASAPKPEATSEAKPEAKPDTAPTDNRTTTPMRVIRPPSDPGSDDARPPGPAKQEPPRRGKP